MFSETSTGIWALGDSSATLINDWLSSAHSNRLARKAQEAVETRQRAASTASQDRDGDQEMGDAGVGAEVEAQAEEREKRRETSERKGKAADRARERMQREIEIIDLTGDSEDPAEVGVDDGRPLQPSATSTVGDLDLDGSTEAWASSSTPAAPS